MSEGTLSESFGTEMECTLLFFAAKQEQWMQHAQCINISPGEHAYTLGQADIWCQIRNHVEQMWMPVTMCNSTGDIPKLVRGQCAKKQHQVRNMDT